MRHIYVNIAGNDQADGSKAFPVRSVSRAQQLVRQHKKSGEKDIIVHIGAGRYYLNETLLFMPQDGGGKDGTVVYQGEDNTFISGGTRIFPQWKPYKNGIYRTDVPEGLEFDQLFINGEKKILARYPNFDPNAKYYGGCAADSFDPQRVKKYQNPQGAYMHAMHIALWGDFHFRVTGQDDDGTLQYEGGWQNNRPAAMHPDIRFIENVFEELDAPGEWYLDRKASILYYMPENQEELRNGTVEVAGINQLVSVIGSENNPVENLSFQNLTFLHAGMTFMEPMEKILRSDWCIYRGGAVYLEGCRAVSLDGCAFLDVGGNGVTVSRWNRKVTVAHCEFRGCGASSVVVVGDTSAVRSPLFNYDDRAEVEKMDWTPGPANNNYPKDCSIEDCLMIQSGRVEKQSAGICLSMCQNIHISNNTIYDVPRAGINICDGTWGGHVLEKNVVFDTVKETGDHGAFNSWGRDRFWDPRYEVMDQRVSENPELPLIDAMEPIVIRKNIFSCDYGWDIDLDDGSSNYHIVKNLCLRGGIKNREGVHRLVEHNIMINNTFHPHVWFHRCEDVFRHNVLFREYEDINLNSFGRQFDYNILCKKGDTEPAWPLRSKSGMDEHSIMADVKIDGLAEGNFAIPDKEWLDKLGIELEDFSDCGVQSPALKRKSRSPFERKIVLQPYTPVFREELIHFEGMKIKTLSGPAEMSATGMWQESGIYILQIDETNPWYTGGLRSNDVLLEVDGTPIHGVEDGIKMLNMCEKTVTVWRNQKKENIKLEKLSSKV